MIQAQYLSGEVEQGTRSHSNQLATLSLQGRTGVSQFTVAFPVYFLPHCIFIVPSSISDLTQTARTASLLLIPTLK